MTSVRDRGRSLDDGCDGSRRAYLRGDHRGKLAPRTDLERIAASIGAACAEAGTALVTGESKVMGRREIDGTALNTSGVAVTRRVVPDCGRRPGDKLLHHRQTPRTSRSDHKPPARLRDIFFDGKRSVSKLLAKFFRRLFSAFPNFSLIYNDIMFVRDSVDPNRTKRKSSYAHLTLPRSVRSPLLRDRGHH